MTADRAEFFWHIRRELFGKQEQKLFKLAAIFETLVEILEA